MGEEFSGLGSSFYIGLPGQSIEEMQEVKLQDASSLLHDEDIGVEKGNADGFSFPVTFTVKMTDEDRLPTKLERIMRMGNESNEELLKLEKEAAILMAYWLNGDRCIARYDRLRRHYNRWRRSYATRKTFYAPKFHNFLHGFMVHYVAMRNYHPETNK